MTDSSAVLSDIPCRKGGHLLWVAPSGGRDRPDPETNEWVPVSLPSSRLYLGAYLAY